VEFRPKTNEPLPNTSSKNEIIHTFSGVAVKKEPIEKVTKIFYGYIYNIENYWALESLNKNQLEI
jgi:hypothetical protein